MFIIERDRSMQKATHVFYYQREPRSFYRSIFQGISTLIRNKISIPSHIITKNNNWVGSD